MDHCYFAEATDSNLVTCVDLQIKRMNMHSRTHTNQSPLIFEIFEITGNLQKQNLHLVSK